MGNLTSSSSFNDLVLNALGADPQQENLKIERQNVLSAQEDNLQSLKKQISSYRAKMASQGAGSLTTGVESGLTDQVNKDNENLSSAFNKKLKANAKANRQKALIAGSDFIQSFF